MAYFFGHKEISLALIKVSDLFHQIRRPKLTDFPLHVEWDLLMMCFIVKTLPYQQYYCKTVQFVIVIVNILLSTPLRAFQG